MIALWYFSFTSLSTVGFGDFNPKSNIERLIIAFFLMFGVAIFSYIMGSFIQILNVAKEFAAENEDGINLSKFFGTLRKFNNEEDIKLSLKKEIESFFDYKWQLDKNEIVFDDEFGTYLSQMEGTDLINRLYYDCLFETFLKSY